MVTVTNKEIYEKLLDIEKQSTITNGKVNVNRWIATTALSLAVTTIFIILSGIVSAYI